MLKAVKPPRWSRRSLLLALPPLALWFGLKQRGAAPAAKAEGRAPRLRQPEGIYPPPGLHWVGDGFRVAGYFSIIPDAVRKLSPFLLLDYHPVHNYSPTTHKRGVGVHPHRGFETVTLAWQGSVAHHDSTGAGGVIGPGDVQWMTAASGILHKEYHEETYGRSGGPFQMAQLWVNLPKAHKFAPPRYQPLVAADMGKLELPNGAGSVRVIAGEFQGVRGPAKTFTPIDVYDVKLNAGGALELGFKEAHNVSLLVMEGEISINGGQLARTNDFIVFRRSGEVIRLTASQDCQLLVLSGEPIDEPVVQRGPFVMNTQLEIEQAIRDYQQGKFGHLE